MKKVVGSGRRGLKKLAISSESRSSESESLG